VACPGLAAALRVRNRQASTEGNRTASPGKRPRRPRSHARGSAGAF